MNLHLYPEADAKIVCLKLGPAGADQVSPHSAMHKRIVMDVFGNSYGEQP